MTILPTKLCWKGLRIGREISSGKKNPFSESDLGSIIKWMCYVVTGRQNKNIVDVTI